jgi:hypothetical protein
LKIMFPTGEKPVKLSAADQDEVVKASATRWEDYTQQWVGWLNKAQESTNLYCDNRPSGSENLKESPEHTGRSNVRMPVIPQAVDAVVAQQHLANFPQDERFFKLRPENDVAHKIQAGLEQHIEDSFEYIDLMAMAQKDRKGLALAGCIAVWHPWAFCKETEYDYKQNEIFGIKLGAPKRIPVEVTKFEGSAFIPLHVEDVRFDATVDSIRDTNVTFRRWMDIEELKKVDKLQNKNDIACYNEFHDQSAARKRDYYMGWGIDPQYHDIGGTTAKEKCLLYEEWGDFCINGKVYENHVLLYSNERVFHGLFPNPHDHQMKPLTLCPYIFMPNSLLGKSMAHDIIPLAHQVNTSINQANDIFSITGNPIYTYLYNDPGLKEYAKHGQLVTRPGMWIPVGSHDSLKPVQHDRQVVQEILGLYHVIKEEIRESTGGLPYATGGASDQEKTLGEAEMLASGTSTRYQLNIQTYDEMRLKPFMRIVVSNLRQYMTEPIKPVDDLEITPEMLKQAKFDVNVTGSKSVMSRKKDFDDLLFVMEKLLPGLVQAGVAELDGSKMKIKAPGLAEELLKMTAAKNLPDLYEVVTPEQQQEQMEEQGFGDELAAIPGLNPGAVPFDMVAAQGPPGVAAPQGGGY